MQNLKERCELIPLKIEDELVYVYINPSLYEYKKLLHGCKEGVRGFADDKNVFVFDSWGGAHWQVAEELEKHNIHLSTKNFGKISNFMYIKNENKLFLEDYAKQYSTEKDLDLIKQVLLKNNNFTKLFSKDEILNADSQNRYFGFKENTSDFKKLVENILEEDAYKDHQRLKEAITTYRRIIDELEERLKKSKQPFVLDITNDVVGQTKTEYGNLTVVFSLIKEQEANGLYGAGHSYIQINLPNIFNLDDKIISDIYPKTGEVVHGMDTNDFIEVINDISTTEVFIHEYTHYIDDVSVKPLSLVNKTKKNKNADYNNNTSELNAYALEWLFKITIELIDKNDKSMSQMTPDERLAFLKQAWNKDEDFMNYYNKLTPESKKRFIKRIYTYLSSNVFGK